MRIASDVVPSIDELFRHHPPRPDQTRRFERVRAAARELGQTILDACPPSADRSAAIRKLREAVMTANAAIALEPAPAERAADYDMP